MRMNVISEPKCQLNKELNYVDTERETVTEYLQIMRMNVISEPKMSTE